jgi:NAD-dependent SIR2 family protein deacetylase
MKTPPCGDGKKMRRKMKKKNHSTDFICKIHGEFMGVTCQECDREWYEEFSRKHPDTRPFGLCPECELEESDE